MSNSLTSSFQELRGKVLGLLDAQRGSALLLGRLAVGLLFLSTGWGKVNNVPKVTQFFAELGIPAPGFHAVFVGCTELVGGIAVVIGLGTRLFSAPLATTMVVALATAKRDSIHGLFDLVGQEEFTYLVMLVMLVVLGPGKLSLDHLLAKRLDAATGAEPSPGGAPVRSAA